MTVNAFCSLSLDPSLVLVCLREDGYCLDLVSRASAFAVSVLSAEQEHVARRFADPALSPDDRFRGIRYREMKTGSPVLIDSVAGLDCELTDEIPGGDHRILIGDVVATWQSAKAEPLVFYGAEYGRLKCERGHP